MNVTKLDGIGACVFDAYGTLFDVNAAAQHCAADLGDKWLPLAELWRGRQLQYTWLRSLMGEYADFWQVTGEALDFAMDALDLEDAQLRERLMELYLQLDAYPEVGDVLRRLQDGGMKTAILSNGSPKMLDAAVANAGIGGALDAVISADQIKVYKTAPGVYQMAVDQLGVAPGAISFQSSNAWDAHAASNFGFRVVWVNRFGQPRERLPGNPDVMLDSLESLPSIVGVEG
ncbi:MAG: haloacid dehalogenase type II [Rhodospirillaceae bacterium]|jgi:2-haloacid dehalogenase|nr:haloacid dehalogenase type II [Rhodospirillaceae bacterium]MBT4044062.1 haloacid dehalogenase type II [Rhodospirillaceae bacterium]MBT4690150.1 haloacid dehalogenase type II [Rhodospirillaceae bacterium]MBT5080715.1 haloacid dehalogenase type II [Rhodospirillaceae bacterium]MBT5524243.1 haloacid dehalogenase type II [Rhodospirillaceae bacterium]